MSDGPPIPPDDSEPDAPVDWDTDEPSPGSGPRWRQLPFWVTVVLTSSLYFSAFIQLGYSAGGYIQCPGAPPSPPGSLDLNVGVGRFVVGGTIIAVALWLWLRGRNRAIASGWAVGAIVGTLTGAGALASLYCSG